MRIRAILAALLAAIALASTATADSAHLATVATPTGVRTLIEHAHTRAQLMAALRHLTPASRRYVIGAGLMPYRTVFSRTTHSVGPGKAHTASCASFSKSTVGKADTYSWIGLHLYHYQSSWQWGGMCYVWSASHQENGWGIAPCWSYTGSTFGSPYGKIGSPMVGRETFGHFDYNCILTEQDVVDSIMKVFGGDPSNGGYEDGDWWWWQAK